MLTSHFGSEIFKKLFFGANTLEKKNLKQAGHFAVCFFSISDNFFLIGMEKWALSVSLVRESVFKFSKHEKIT